MARRYRVYYDTFGSRGGVNILSTDGATDALQQAGGVLLAHYRDATEYLAGATRKEMLNKLRGTKRISQQQESRAWDIYKSRHGERVSDNGRLNAQADRRKTQPGDTTDGGDNGGTSIRQGIVFQWNSSSKTAAVGWGSKNPEALIRFQRGGHRYLTEKETLSKQKAIRWWKDQDKDTMANLVGSTVEHNNPAREFIDPAYRSISPQYGRLLQGYIDKKLSDIGLKLA
jgi:hypothetical protein